MKIQYKNKVAIDLDPSIPEVNKVTDNNMNEIKNVVNTNADSLDDLNEQVTEYTNGVDERLGNLETNIENINTEIENITSDLDNTYSKTEVDNLLSDKATETSLNEEITNRENADTNLQNQIDAITASSDVVDIVGTYQDLLNYDTQHLGNNDIIKVLQDSTHNNAVSYYRWNKNDEEWTYVGSEGPFYTKGETDTLLNNKVDKVAGKGLSTNDYTTAEKNKLAGIDLTDYVKNTDYANAITAGAIKGNVNGFEVNSTNGNPSVAVRDYTAYGSLANSYFISKGTLENVLNARIGNIETLLYNINRGSGV